MLRCTCKIPINGGTDFRELHMPKDATMPSPVLDDLTRLTSDAIAPVEDVFAKAKETVRAMVVEDGKVSPKKLEENQYAAHALAWLATYTEALRQMQSWAEHLSDA